MAKRTKLRNQRPKALFGADGAIMAAATLAAAGIQAAAQYATGKQGADAALEGAKRQADALAQQNENANRLQTEMMQFTKDQNDQSRQIIKDNQMNLQLMAGAQSMRDRREQSKTIVKYGGSKRRRLMDIASSFLQGGNMPFRITDGGGVIPIGQTPEGFDIYKIYGDSHNEYHKFRGKYRTGVGFRFPDGSEIEAERGELAINTPDNVYFLSRRSRHGLNPAKAVEDGMSPRYAYNLQETYKAMDGIDSEGNHTSPVERRYHASLGGTIPYYNTAIPYNNYTIMPGATAVAFEQSQMNNRRNSFKNGGNVRKQIASLNNRRKLAGGGFFNQWYGSPIISGVGNFLGAGLSTLGTILGANYTNRGIEEGSKILADAYRNIKGVDIKDVFGDNFNASFDQGAYMPALRSSYYNADPWLEEVHRNMRRVQGVASNTNGSSAAQLNRLNTAAANAATETGKIYANKANIQEQNKQQQMESINNAAAHNAQMKIEGIKNKTGILADIAKFNANIENERYVAPVEIEANAKMQQAQVNSNKWLSTMQAFGNAATQTGLGFANALYNRDVRRDNMTMAKLAATDSGLVNYYGDRNTPLSEAQDYFNSLIEAANGARTDSARDTYLGLARRLASLRGFDWNLAWGVLNKNRINTSPTLPSIATPSITINPNNLPRLN